MHIARPTNSKDSPEKLSVCGRQEVEGSPTAPRGWRYVAQRPHLQTGLQASGAEIGTAAVHLEDIEINFSPVRVPDDRGEGGAGPNR